MTGAPPGLYIACTPYLKPGHIWNTVGTYCGHTVETLLGHFGHTGHTVGTLGILWEHCGHTVGILWEHCGHIEHTVGTLWAY